MNGEPRDRLELPAHARAMEAPSWTAKVCDERCTDGACRPPSLDGHSTPRSPTLGAEEMEARYVLALVRFRRLLLPNMVDYVSFSMGGAIGAISNAIGANPQS